MIGWIESKFRKAWLSLSRIWSDGFKYLLYVWLFLIFFYIVFFVFYKKTTYSVFEKYFDHSFGSSFSVSLLENLVIFPFLGAIVTIISIALSIKNPEDYDYETRLGAVLNSDSAFGDKGLRTYVNERFERLLTFNNRVNTSIYVNEYNTSQAAYEIYTSIQYELYNSVKGKKLFKKLRATVKTEFSVDGEYGRIHDLKYYNQERTEIKDYFAGVGSKHIADGSFKEDIEIPIEENNMMYWELAYTIWHRTIDFANEKDWHSITIGDFTRSMVMTVVNNSKNYNRIIVYDVFLYSEKDKKSKRLYPQITLKKGESKRHEIKAVLYPLDSVKFFIHGQK